MLLEKEPQKGQEKHMNLEHKLMILTPLALGAALAVKGCETKHKVVPRTVTQVEDFVESGEAAYQWNKAKEHANDYFVDAKTTIDNGVLSARYGNTSNWRDILIAAGAIGLGLGLTGRIVQSAYRGRRGQ